MNKKIPTSLAISIIFFVIAAIIGVAFWFCRDKETTLFQDEIADWQTYRNEEYGFNLTLFKDWQEYSATTIEIEYGWKIVIRHPKWTEANPYEDIPILVYPINQWEEWEANNFEDYPTAAPFGPSERGRNAKYVFATAPRYNYDFRTGYEDVENIIKTLKTF